MPERRPYIIGMTGNIACGKSLVGSMLADLGADVIDADKVAHEIMATGSDVLARIAERFGEDVVAADGSLDRKALGRIVFGDPDAFRDLEAITHPPTVAEVLRRTRASAAPVVVIDAIKLYESGLAEHCDETWTVSCEPEVQLQRLRERDGFSEQQARQRIDAQPPQEEKRSRADRVIDNSGERDRTHQQVHGAWRTLPLRHAG